MTSTSHAEPNSALPPETCICLDQLADLLLERYHITAPPVPASLMQKQTLYQLGDIPYDQISFGLGHGIYEYAPHLAEARLLYHRLSNSEAALHAGFEASWPISRHEIKYFARRLLLPEAWIRNLHAVDRTPAAISEKFQVPSQDAIVRLAELGLPVPADIVIDLDS